MTELIWYWINLKDNVERYNHMKSQFSLLNVNNIRIDALHHDKSYIGCCLSHIKAIYTAYTNCILNDHEYALIMEDDIDFSFNNNLKLSIDNLIFNITQSKQEFDIIQLHYIEPTLIKGLNVVSKITHLSNKILKGYFMSCAFYLMSKSGMKKFLDLMVNLESNSYSVKVILDNPNCRAEEMIYRYIDSYTLLLPFANTVENNKSQISDEINYMNNNYNNMIELRELYNEINVNAITEITNINQPINIPYSLHWINDEKIAINFVKRIYKLTKEYFCFLHSGLGNRLFQYCSVYGLSRKNNATFSVLLSAINFQHTVDSKNEIYQEFFNLNINERYPIIKTIEPLACFDNFEVSDKIYTYHCLINDTVNIIEENKSIENQYQYFNATENKSYIFTGFFQTEKYFINYRNEILQIFKEPEYIKDKFNNFNLKEVVAIHVRLGDFLNISKHFVNLNTYYKNAIDYCIENNNKKFVIVSEEKDIEKIYRVYPILRGISLSTKIIKTDTEIEDLYFMTRCKGVICSNSTFAWWGAWLNNNSAKIVIIPSKWMNDRTDIQNMNGAIVISI